MRLPHLHLAAVLATAAFLLPSGVAAADPAADSPPPSPGAPCASDLVDVMSRVPDLVTPVVCGRDARWAAVADPYPISDRWLSAGPAIELHGQGRTNPSMLSGAWEATPATPESTCRSEQVAVLTDRPALGAPQVDDGRPGRPLAVEVAPTMATIELSGDCLWQRITP